MFTPFPGPVTIDERGVVLSVGHRCDDRHRAFGRGFRVGSWRLDGPSCLHGEQQRGCLSRCSWRQQALREVTMVASTGNGRLVAFKYRPQSQATFSQSCQACRTAITTTAIGDSAVVSGFPFITPSSGALGIRPPVMTDLPSSHEQRGPGWIASFIFFVTAGGRCVNLSSS